ncbi:hypothetical protein RQY88_001028 [Vibrio vulnificus]|nr:hypothetical protein [Vibrio vulnificus]EJE8547589.1 hypothetical protein [Vibrio vulnificus]EJO2017407.1 hypothetical protein [Vibrio vulnificus]ELH9599779.1 hypothetical protein [Vibrio vulnificus]ELH9614135.1 hypothetical protein [Vibrio vulnificus]
MTWITLPSVSVQNGSKIVTVNNTQTTNIKVGDALLIGNYQPVEIAGVFATQLSLRTNWSNAAQANASAVVMPTFGDFNAATQALRQATQVTQGNFKTLEDWGTKLGNITFEGQDNSKHTARTLLQMDADVSELEEKANSLIVSLSGLNFALSKAIVDVLRSRKKEQYVASGFIHTGKHFNSGNLSSVNEGMTVDIGTPNVIYLGARDGVTGGNVSGSSETSYPVMNVAGFEVHLLGINATLTNWQASTIKLPPAPDGTTTYNKATGAVVKHPDTATAFAVAAADSSGNTEVVVNRVDMAGLEFFKRKVDEFLYPYGSPQCGYTTVDGVPTTEDTSRPITYFATYDGDTTSRGRGWRLADLTFEQLAVIMSNPKHNAWYNEKGELLQFGPRQRSFAGPGNGDWGATNIGIHPAKDRYLGFTTNTFVHSQGMLNTVTPLNSVTSRIYESNVSGYTEEVGVYKVNNGSGATAVDDECYFYVLATVPRLNQGAYHPSFNPMGTTLWRDATGNHGGGSWSSSFIGKAARVEDCFFYYPLDTTPYTKPGALAYHGSIGRGASRPDGRFYDAVCAGGQGGVIDWRLPARDMVSEEEAAKIFQKVVNGTYLGLEELPITFMDTNKDGDNASGSGFTPNKPLSEYQVGDTGYIEGTDGVFRPYKVKQITTIVQFETPVSRKGGGKVVNTTKANISVSGNFTALDVLGSPASIFVTPDLANGWMGRLIHVIPKGSVEQFPYTRKNVAQVGRGTDAVTTTNGGVTWVNSGITTTPNTTNIFGGAGQAVAAVGVYVIPYAAFAKQTRQSVNKSVLNGSGGIGAVWASSFNSTGTGGCLLAESLLGKVLTSNNGWQDVDSSLTVHMAGLTPSGALNRDANAPTVHEPLTLAPPNNNSPAVKALWHQASNNRQATLNFLWNELVYRTALPLITDTGAQMVRKRGERYLVNVPSSHLHNRVLCWEGNEGNISVDYTSYYIDSCNVVRSKSNDARSTLQLFSGDGWGDDKTIRIVDGQSTYINLNGDTCLYGISELAMPYGYTKNQAGAGKQVVGVDL